MVFLHETRVEFCDTDMAGIMHFSNFFRVMERTEAAFLRSLGFDVCWQADGLWHGFPRVSAHCDYRQPARYGDVIRDECCIERLGEKSVTFRHEMFVGTTAIALGKLIGVYCQKTDHGPMQSHTMPTEMLAGLRNYLCTNPT
ncbi:MAG: acyl-CoA thioesterase [Gemmataceae bacterium]